MSHVKKTIRVARRGAIVYWAEMSATSNLPLFTYGHLRRSGKGNPAIAIGDLRRRGDDAAAIFGSGAAHTSLGAGGCGVVHGQVMDVDEETLRRIDAEEAPQYTRVVIMLFSGSFAWSYEYTGRSDFFAMPVVADGLYPM